MRRNVVAIVGSAGAISDPLRQAAESLAAALANAGFDLVTGGMDGVMRAVARGHARAGCPTNLLHVEPGRNRAWQRNPHPAATLRTNVGSMRNHLVVRGADLVIAVCGGAGTLSEIALAWQESKPLAALGGFGGWSERLAGTRLDERGDFTVAACDSVAEAVAWAQTLRPEGVYAGRLNSGFYPCEVPVLHRIHDAAPSPVHQVHMRYDMSVAKADVVPRLAALNERVARWNDEHRAEAVALVTFDDGWRDAELLAENFARLENLQPVLFVGENHFASIVQPLPLQRFYEHCARHGRDPEDAQAFVGVTRTNLKGLPENEQHHALDRLGVEPLLDPDWLLDASAIAALQRSGWIVASHAHRHEDLHKREALANELVALADAVEARGHMPWLAWPEGRWTQASFDVAKQAGFHLQLGLSARNAESCAQGEAPAGMVAREVWR